MNVVGEQKKVLVLVFDVAGRRLGSHPWRGPRLGLLLGNDDQPIVFLVFVPIGRVRQVTLVTLLLFATVVPLLFLGNMCSFLRCLGSILALDGSCSWLEGRTFGLIETKISSKVIVA